MNEKRSEDLTRHERMAFGSLADEAMPSPECENAVVEALRERGLIRRTSWLSSLLGLPAFRLAMAGGALAITFFLGVQVGRTGSDPGAPEAYLDAEAETEEPDIAPAPGGEILAAGPVEEDVFFAAAAAKPRIDPDDPGYKSFPPYPLDGRPRTVSTRPR